MLRSFFVFCRVGKRIQALVCTRQVLCHSIPRQMTVMQNWLLTACKQYFPILSFSKPWCPSLSVSMNSPSLNASYECLTLRKLLLSLSMVFSVHPYWSIRLKFFPFEPSQFPCVDTVFCPFIYWWTIRACPHSDSNEHYIHEQCCANSSSVCLCSFCGTTDTSTQIVPHSSGSWQVQG